MWSMTLFYWVRFVVFGVLGGVPLLTRGVRYKDAREVFWVRFIVVGAWSVRLLTRGVRYKDAREVFGFVSWFSGCLECPLADARGAVQGCAGGLGFVS